MPPKLTDHKCWMCEKFLPGEQIEFPPDPELEAVCPVTGKMMTAYGNMHNCFICGHPCKVDPERVKLWHPREEPEQANPLTYEERAADPDYVRALKTRVALAATDRWLVRIAQAQLDEIDIKLSKSLELIETKYNGGVRLGVSKGFRAEARQIQEEARCA